MKEGTRENECSLLINRNDFIAEKMIEKRKIDTFFVICGKIVVNLFTS